MSIPGEAIVWENSNSGRELPPLLGKYNQVKSIEYIGGGGMGDVYRLSRGGLENSFVDYALLKKYSQSLPPVIFDGLRPEDVSHFSVDTVQGEPFLRLVGKLGERFIDLKSWTLDELQEIYKGDFAANPLCQAMIAGYLGEAWPQDLARVSTEIALIKEGDAYFPVTFIAESVSGSEGGQSLNLFRLIMDGDLDQSLDLIGKATDVVEKLWVYGICHGDLSPDNIMKGDPAVIDTDTMQFFARGGQIIDLPWGIGKGKYSAPEYFMRNNDGVRNSIGRWMSPDLYSIAVIVGETLAGVNPLNRAYVRVVDSSDANFRSQQLSFISNYESQNDQAILISDLEGRIAYRLGVEFLKDGDQSVDEIVAYEQLAKVPEVEDVEESTNLPVSSFVISREDEKGRNWEKDITYKSSSLSATDILSKFENLDEDNRALILAKAKKLAELLRSATRFHPEERQSFERGAVELMERVKQIYNAQKLEDLE